MSSLIESVARKSVLQAQRAAGPGERELPGAAQAEFVVCDSTIEQTFRDYKALFGMEQERTQQPTERLGVLLWALMLGMALDLLPAACEPGARVPGESAAGRAAREATGISCRPQVPAWPRLAPATTEAPGNERPQYPSESVTRAGLHQFFVQLVLGQLPFQAELQALYAKSQRMQERPQVRERRRAEPAVRRRTRREPCSSPA